MPFGPRACSIPAVGCGRRFAIRSTLVGAITLVVLAGCSSQVVAPPTLGISNTTTLPLALIINGRSIGEYGPGQTVAAIDPGALPGLPWQVEVRSLSGGSVLTFAVTAGNVAQPMKVSTSDTGCGIVTVWTGDVVPPLFSPMPTGANPGETCWP